MEKAFLVTGPTSGIGRQAALTLARSGTVVLVGRNPAKLSVVRRTIEARGGSAAAVVCDLADPKSARRAATEIAGLGFDIVGLLNNAGVMESHQPTRTPAGWDTTFATNHLGPWALTEALLPTLSDGARVLFVVSAVEDGTRKPAAAAGFRGGRFVSVEASARGEWLPGGSVKTGFDAYATSKQALLAASLGLSRETSRLRINALEPGLNVTTGLGGASGLLRLLQLVVFPLLIPIFRPFFPILTTPRQAARVIAALLTGAEDSTGVYFDERGRPMRGSDLVHDPRFQDRVLMETRGFLRSFS